MVEDSCDLPVSRQPLVEGLVVVAKEPLDVELLALHVRDVVVAVEDDVVHAPALDHRRHPHLTDLHSNTDVCKKSHDELTRSMHPLQSLQFRQTDRHRSLSHSRAHYLK